MLQLTIILSFDSLIVYNVFFRIPIIETESDDSKHAKYEINQSVYEWYEFVKKYTKTREEIEKECKITDDDEKVKELTPFEKAQSDAAKMYDDPKSQKR